MSQLVRFGRRVPLPSTVQIVHDLLVIQANENVRPDVPADAPSVKTDPETGSKPAALVAPPHV